MDILSTKFNHFISEHDDELWIASAGAGINRFDGLNTFHYPLNDGISGLKGTYVQSEMFEDSHGLLWTSTYEQLCFFNKEHNCFNCQQLTFGDEVFKLGYHVFHIDLEDKIWLRAEDQVLIYNSKTKKIESNLGFTKANSFSIKGDTIIGSPWLNDTGFELWTKDELAWSCKNHILSSCLGLENIQVIKSQWINDSFWLLSNDGLVQVDFNDPCSSSFFTFPYKEKLVCNEMNKYNSYILLGTDGRGVLSFDVMKKEFVNSKDEKWKEIDYVYPTQNGGIIYSNFNKGIGSFSKGFLGADFDSVNDLQFIWKKLINNKRNLYLLSKDGSLVRFNKIDQDIKVISRDVVDFVISDDYLVSASKYAFFRINLLNDKSYQISHSWTQFQSIHSNNKFVFADADNTIFSYEVGENFKERKLVKDGSRINALGEISEMQELYAFDGSVIKISMKSGEYEFNMNEYVNDLKLNSSGNKIFAATNNGLYSLDFDSKNGIENKILIGENEIFKSLNIDKDFIYFTSENRIGRYGLNNGKFNFSNLVNSKSRPCYFIENDTIYVGTDFIASYSLNEFFKESVCEVELSDFSVNKNKVGITQDENLSLTYDQNEISWKASIDSWNFSSLGKIEYQLLPDQEKWISAANNSQVKLPKLLPNSYTLNIRGTSSTENPSSTKTYNFTIKEPWHNTILAKFLFAGILAFLFYSLFRYRLNQLNKKNSIKDEIRQLEKSALQAQMNPHFIFNCLNSIQSFIMDNEKENAMEYLGKFARLIRSNLNASMEEKIMLFEEVSILENYLSLEQLRLDYKFEYKIDVEKGINAETTLIPPMLIQPFVENAVIHGMRNIEKDGLISVSFKQVEDSLKVTIKDNGIASSNTPKHKDHKSVGVKITKQRLAHINQSAPKDVNVEIKSLDTGTTVEVGIAL